MRLLRDQGMLAWPTQTGDVGQQLGDWLDFRQAIGLHSVLDAQVPLPGRPLRPLSAAQHAALVQQVQSVRRGLEASIAQGSPATPGAARIDLPPFEPDEPLVLRSAFEPFRRYYAAHQRQMEPLIRRLRQGLRAHVQGQARLAELASLDAAMEGVLQEREARWLASVPSLIEKRWVLALRDHLASAGDAPDLERWMAPWRQVLRSTLLAELDLRFQPVDGLLEALTPPSVPTP